MANHHGEQQERGSQQSWRSKPKDHSGSNRSAKDEGQPYSAEKFDLLIEHWLVTCCPLRTVSFTFSFEQGSDHSREIRCVYADAASLTKSSILKAQCEG